MTDEQKQLAAYLFNFLQRDGIPIATREVEVMATAKQWLKDLAEGNQDDQGTRQGDTDSEDTVE